MTPSGTVLLIEDEETIADMLRGFFEREGYRFVHAPTGEAGITSFRSRPPSVVLLDLNLPDGDGLDVCKSIRASSEVPVIMLTARDGEIDKVVGLEIGADDYVVKPFSPRELVARVKAVLRRSEEPRPERAIIETSGYTIDSGRREVKTPEGVAVRPTAKEFDLLWYLSVNRGLVLTRGQILEGVWGYDFLGESRTVDVHIRQLRKKISGIPIETIWGVGYRLGD